MSSIGHGISDAVRNHIPVWVDNDLIEVLYPQYVANGGILSKDQFARRVRNASDWVRKSRSKTGSGFERKYHCKTVQKATLIVHSPETDMSANGYAFCIDGKVVAGGRTKLQSTHVSTKVSRTDKTTSRPEAVTFVKFSEEELIKMRTEMEFGDGFQQLEMEREA